MDALTYAMSLNPPADACLERVGQSPAKFAGASTKVVGPRLSHAPRWPADERRGSQVRSKEFGSRTAANIETALFIVTLAAIACLNLGALPALVL